MVFVHSWLPNAEVFLDDSPNMITIDGKPKICVKLITPKLGHNTNYTKFFVCYDVIEGTIEGEKISCLKQGPSYFP